MSLVIPECPYFNIEEWAVSSAFPHLVKPVPLSARPNVERLVRTVLWPWRDAFGKKFTALSGYRSPALNAAIGGSKTSQHTLGEAWDFTCEDVVGAFRNLLRMPVHLPHGQVIFYPEDNFIHVALPSAKYPTPTFCIHSPAANMQYAVMPVSESLLKRALA